MKDVSCGKASQCRKDPALRGNAYGSMSSLVIIRGNRTTVRSIQEEVQPHVLSYIWTMPNRLFQQEIARPHVARFTLAHFETNQVDLLLRPP